MTHFGGVTFDAAQDGQRLITQLNRVRDVMFDGDWHTLQELNDRCGGTVASVSARVRDLRKKRFGEYNVERRRVQAGLWAYRLEIPNAMRSQYEQDM